jgi:hypothetical protein
LRVEPPKPFTLKTFSYGSLFIPVQNQELSSQEIFNYLNQIIPDYAIEITAVETGFTDCEF